MRYGAVNASIPAGTNKVEVAAPTIAGYQFVVWVGGSSQGWAGLVYPALPENTTVNFYTDSNSTSARNIRCYALYRVNNAQDSLVTANAKVSFGSNLRTVSFWGTTTNGLTMLLTDTSNKTIRIDFNSNGIFAMSGTKTNQAPNFAEQSH